MCMILSILPTKIPLITKNFLKDSNAFCTLRNYFICQAKFPPCFQEVFTPSVILMGFFSVFIVKAGKKKHFSPNLLAPEHLIKRLSYLSKKKHQLWQVPQHILEITKKISYCRPLFTEMTRADLTTLFILGFQCFQFFHCCKIGNSAVVYYQVIHFSRCHTQSTHI